MSEKNGVDYPNIDLKRSSDQKISEIDNVVPLDRRPTRRDLIRRFSRDLMALAGKEFELARSEMGDKVDEAQHGLISYITGGVVLFFGGALAFATVVLALATVMQAWLACLIVCMVVSVVGAALLAKAKREFRLRNMSPDTTIRSVKETVHGLRKHS